MSAISQLQINKFISQDKNKQEMDGSFLPLLSPSFPDLFYLAKGFLL